MVTVCEVGCVVILGADIRLLAYTPLRIVLFTVSAT